VYTGANLNFQNDSGVMIQNSVQVSTPGSADAPLTAFNAAYGSAVPPTPAGWRGLAPGAWPPSPLTTQS
jgi:hypothetical protein